MTKTLARLADLEPAILAANPVPADPLGDLQRAIKAINHGLVSGMDAPTLANLYCTCMVVLIQLASQRQTTLAGCRGFFFGLITANCWLIVGFLLS